MLRFNNKNFLSLFVLHMLTLTSNYLITSAVLTIIVYHNFGFNTFFMSQISAITIAIYAVPFLFFAPLSAILSDKYNKINIIRSIMIFNLFIISLFSYTLLLHNITMLILMIFLVGINASAFLPIKYAILTDYIKSKNLILVISYLEITTLIAVLIGKSLGSAFSITHHNLLILFLVIFGVICLIFSFILKQQQQSTHHSHRKNINNIKANLYDGIKSLKIICNNSNIKHSLLNSSWSWTFQAILNSQTPLFIKHYLRGDTSVLSVAYLLLSIGIILGTFLVMKSKNKTYFYKGFISCLSVTIFLLIMLFLNVIPHNFKNPINFTQIINYPTVITSLICYFIIGIGTGFFITISYIQLQQHSTIANKVKIMSFIYQFSAMFILIWTMISFFILNISDIWWLFLITAIINMFITFNFALFNITKFKL